MIFKIDPDNHITVLDAMPPSDSPTPEGTSIFSTSKELTQLALQWPVDRLAEIWNHFAGAPPLGDLKPVKKFENRQIAIVRLWTAIQSFWHSGAPFSRRNRITGAMLIPRTRVLLGPRILAAGQHRGSTSAIRTALNALVAN